MASRCLQLRAALLCGSLLGFASVPAAAQVVTPLQAVSIDMRAVVVRTPPNESGFTLRDLFDSGLWSAVRQPLPLQALDRFAAGLHRAPRPGVQVELLTPGRAGVTVHFRW